jgi:hypothetical protein
MNENIEAVPALRESREECIDFGIASNVERKTDIAAELRRHLRDPFGKFLVLVAERELGALAMHRLSNSERDRSITYEADDNGALAGEKPHVADTFVQ